MSILPNSLAFFLIIALGLGSVNLLQASWARHCEMLSSLWWETRLLEKNPPLRPIGITCQSFRGLKPARPKRQKMTFLDQRAK